MAPEYQEKCPVQTKDFWRLLQPKSFIVPKSFCIFGEIFFLHPEAGQGIRLRHVLRPPSSLWPLFSASWPHL